MINTRHVTATVSQLTRRAVALTLVLFLLQTPQLFAQISSIAAAQAGAPKSLHIAILEGEDALNNIRQRTAREPIVQVEDENHKPVAGALVLFTIKRGAKGASGTFSGTETLASITGLDGQAIAKGLQPNGTAGSFTISVSASVGTVTTSAVITQTNVFGSLASSTASQAAGAAHHVGGLFGGHFWIVVGGVAVTTGAIVTTVLVTRTQGATITAGAGTVKP